MIPAQMLLAEKITAAAVVAVSTTFTYGLNGAAESHLYDGDDTTSAADPNGLQTTTAAAYDYGVAFMPTQCRLHVANSFGFSNASTFMIQYSDTGLSGPWTDTGTTITGNAGTNQTVTASLSAGSHRYWRIVYNAGTTGGNVWIGELGWS